MSHNLQGSLFKQCNYLIYFHISAIAVDRDIAFKISFAIAVEDTKVSKDN